MSAPDTNVEKQEKRHWGPLFGIKAAMVYGAVLLLVFIVFIFAAGNDPTDDPTQTDGATQLDDGGAAASVGD
ncbi:MAG: hypothetical protein ACU0CI_14700 [Shimia sp.]